MRHFKLSIPNPWETIVKEENIAECDKDSFPHNKSAAQYADEINSKDDEIELTFSTLPDPFSGNPNSKVYCLNKNPGRPDPCFDGENAFANATINNLLLKSDNCFWAENIKNRCGKLHDGVAWLAKRTKELERILGKHPDIFFVEYFPYHSSKGFSFPKSLPSYEFSNKLIEKAMDEGKMIIIMREKRKWLNRINGLKDYYNLYTLKCPQGGYLTPNNIIKERSGTPLTDDEIQKYFTL